MKQTHVSKRFMRAQRDEKRADTGDIELQT